VLQAAATVSVLQITCVANIKMARFLCHRYPAIYLFIYSCLLSTKHNIALQLLT